MKKTLGKFIVIEGTDGSGKAEQTKRLVGKLSAGGFRVEVLDFPQHGKPSGYFVDQYLNGVYGGADSVGPEKASIFYALDRFDVSQKVKTWLGEGAIVISNRYVASNLGHQGSKIADKEARGEYFRWDYNLEYEILGIPRPDLNIFLHVPAEIAYDLIGKKKERKYLRGEKRDIHEANPGHLKKAEAVYEEIARIFPADFLRVECAENGRLLSIDEIHAKVWDAVSGFLDIKP